MNERSAYERAENDRRDEHDADRDRDGAFDARGKRLAIFFDLFLDFFFRLGFPIDSVSASFSHCGFPFRKNDFESPFLR